MRITLVQSKLEWGNKEANVSNFDKIAAEHASKTDLLVLPETFSTGFYFEDLSLIEDMQGETIARMKQWAQNGNFAVFGSLLINQDDNTYNRGLFVFPDGRVEVYDKRHPFLGEEKKRIVAGDKDLIVEWGGLKIKLMICYDIRFPIWARYREGAEYDLLIYIANFPAARIDIWDTLIEARAIENQCYACGVNCVGTDNMGYNYNGHTQLIDPIGKVVSRIADVESVETFEIDKAFIDKIRTRFPILQDADKFNLC